MARENRSDRGAMLALATLFAVFSLTVFGAVSALAYYYDTDGDGLPDYYEIKHGIHGTVYDEGADWDNDGLADAVEDANGNGVVDVGETDPYNWDTDGDGIADGIEGLTDSTEDADTLINALDLDSDGDFIPDGVEDADHDGVWEPIYGETNRLDADSDDDGLIDGLEYMWGTNPLNANTDGDAWSDGYEVYLADDLAPGIEPQITDPTNSDCDDDGRLDGVGNEDASDADGDGIINALDFDSDNDGLIDSDEDANEDSAVDNGETDPEVYDTDADGFSDGYEIYHAYSDPLTGEDSDGDGWKDGQEIVVYKTNPNDVDTDDDGIHDNVENPLGTPYPGRDTDGDDLIDALDLDSDNDGIADADEDYDGDGVVDAGETNPYDVDTDGDGLWDNAEYRIFGTDPMSASDPNDTDGVASGDEIYTYNTNFDLNDTDGDGVAEGTAVGTDRVNLNTDSGRPKPYGDSSINALDRDADGDGLWDADESSYDTSMIDWDSDDDGLLDGEEVHIWLTDPADSDSDDDGLTDGSEVDSYGTNPLDANTDDDYVNDGVEVNSWGSDPLDPDTDGDGIQDGQTITGTYIDADGVTQDWSYTEDNTDAELGGDTLPNVLDTDSDWREWEDPPTYVYLDFHDRTEIAYQNYVAALVRDDGKRFHVGPLNPGEPDTDSDGYPDAQEVACGFDPLDARDYGDCSYTPDDTDSDGLFDIEEHVLGTADDDADTDNDGLWDGDELHPNWWTLDGVAQGVPTNPLDDNMDTDSFNDFQEVTAGTDGYITNPHYGDTDGDSINDYTEYVRGYDPTDFDMDNDELYDGGAKGEDKDADGILDANETDPQDGDTDDDGIYDGPELTFDTDARDTDTDDDGIMDGWEVGYNAGNIGADTNGGTFGAGDQDTPTKTDPRLADSDFDGYDDGVEDADGDGQYDSAAGETDAQSRDSDGDNLPDYYELAGNVASSPYAVGWVNNSGDVTLAYNDDTDGDSLEDNLEYEQVCRASDDTDTDGDGLLDGDEYHTYETDPTNVDTDSDGCWETVAAVSDIEAADVDSDGDGVMNAMDVDSDNDWVWDGSGSEDCAGVNDADSDGLPNILDNDTDNDNLSDVQEMGLDTWHQYADNDRDFDEDGILDGDEYYQVIHQPHTGEVGFRASDPKDFDTDDDGLHDGFEVGKTAGYPVDPIYGGTNPDPGVWDADGTPNSHVGHWDSDMDGLTDFAEDADMDGDDTDIGVTETNPQDDDTDNDGVIDGYEVTDLNTDPLDCDTDSDGLADGLEHGILGAMGWDTSVSNPCSPSQRYDTADLGAYTTDPLDSDSDNDALLDGTEDQDLDGKRDGNSPYDHTSDWATIGETDPNEWDTDRGGQNDGTEVGAGDDPLLFTDGDWDLDIVLGGGPSRTAGDTLSVGSDGIGAIPPGSSGTEPITVWLTDAGTNPDAADGPSTTTEIDSVYMRATSLHWAGPLWNMSYSVPDTSTLDWFHYTNVTFSPAVFSIGGGGRASSVVVDVTVNVPEGAMPGWYFGYVQVETRRAYVEQELPDDFIMLKVYVGPLKDIDICDDDGDPLGIGLESDPYDFPDPAVQGEMHLVGAPNYPGTILGMFRVANPNTNPDGVWPWPGGYPDGINDFNYLPALPSVGRTWDTNTLDTQGNVNLTHHIEARYEFASGPANPTSVIDFDSPLVPYMNLAAVDSFYVSVNTTNLPMGLYSGLVRVWEDVDNDNVWDGSETFDTFIFKFWLTIPDFDIDDDYANMAGNELNIDVTPGQDDVLIGEILVINPDQGNNVDAWDGPSDETIYRLEYYDPTADLLTQIPIHGVGAPPDTSQAFSFRVYSAENSTYWFKVWLDGVWENEMAPPDSLYIGDQKKLRLWVSHVPDVPAGTYRTSHPDAWLPGDGTVPICATGAATGLGWEIGAGPGIVYDPEIGSVARLMDYFHLTVHVMPVIGAEFSAASLTLTGDHGEQVCGSSTINNTGNADVIDAHFDVTQLVGNTHGLVISENAVDFEPASLTVPLGESGSVETCVDIPVGQRADTYVGTIALLANGEEEYDTLTLNVVVNCIKEMDVLESAYGVSGNVMTLIPGDGGTGSKQFQLTNLGNCDVTGVSASVSGLPSGLNASASVASTVPWQEFILGTVSVDWASPWPHAGTYHGTVTVTASGGLTDSFGLDVVVSPAMDIADNAYDVILNTMQLAPAPDGTATGEFQLRNLGTLDLTGIAGAAVSGLPTGVSGTVSIASSCDWNSSLIGDVDVTWSDPAVTAGEYLTTVTVTANGGLSDNFALRVVIAELADAQFTEEGVSVDGVAGLPTEAVVEVENIGNISLASGRVTFGTNDLVGESGSTIPAANIEVVPATAAIGIDQTVSFDVQILVPEGLLGQQYSGALKLYLDGDYLGEIELTVTLDRGDVIVIYPNPYKMSEHEGGITIALPAGSENAPIKVYDMFGVLVADLGSGGGGERQGGERQWDLKNDDGKTVASGMYIVTIDTGDKVVTRKIMVIK